MNLYSTAIVLLNWNGAEDTIACVQSLLRMRSQDFFVVVCDNNSSDGSFEVLREWGEAELGEAFSIFEADRGPLLNARMVLIQTGSNLGFAGGCNVGIRYALLYSRTEYIWLLNNDTVVDAESLGSQLHRMQSQPGINVLGSTIVFFDEPSRMQAAAGYDFNFWTARVLDPFSNLSVDHPPAEDLVEKHLKYVSGASMFVRSSFVEEIGLLNEQYFLYFEEVDWAVRAGERFHPGYCSQSKVFHKEGRSIGSDRRVEQRSGFSERYLARSRVLFVRSYFPWRLPVCLAWIFGVGVLRLARGRFQPVWNSWRGTVLGLRAPRVTPPKINEWPLSMQHGRRENEAPHPEGSFALHPD